MALNWEHLAMFVDSFGCHNSGRRRLLASSVSRTEILLNILQCTGQHTCGGEVKSHYRLVFEEVRDKSSVFRFLDLSNAFCDRAIL